MVKLINSFLELIGFAFFQDPINKQWVNCDDTLAKIFGMFNKYFFLFLFFYKLSIGRKRVRAFGMLKDLRRHMSDPDNPK